MDLSNRVVAFGVYPCVLVLDSTLVVAFADSFLTSPHSHHRHRQHTANKKQKQKHVVVRQQEKV
jgi:hypothetical protein